VPLTDQKSDNLSIADKLFVKPVQGPSKLKSYHFVGIGGCGMSALGQMLFQRGHAISGSDQVESETTRRLAEEGIQIFGDHRGDHLGERLDALVVSAAVDRDNPEWRRAEAMGVEVVKYAELLGELTGEIDTLAIAGTHGKSTTSGWLSYMLCLAGLDPSYVIGAHVDQLNSASAAGSGDRLVIEACEFDRSFLNFHPQGAAILNIEPDHLDYYRDLEEIIGAFADFSATLPADGYLVANGDDPNVVLALKKSLVRPETFSLQSEANWWPGDLRFEQGHGHFDLRHNTISLGSVRLSLPGVHNVANALAVAALANHAGLSGGQILRALETFDGVGRRLSFKGQPSGITILDDYAHHPTEIRVTLEAIGAKYQPRRLWCVFQPHQHSRTRFLMDEFASSLAAADRVLLPEIYFVRDSETSCQSVTAETLAKKINSNGGNCKFLGDFQTILDMLIDEVAENDLVVTMGAGDVWKIADELVCRLE
jgi:UDP-N-acetylmuramate--alanine ligase